MLDGFFVEGPGRGQPLKSTVVVMENSTPTQIVPWLGIFRVLPCRRCLTDIDPYPTGSIVSSSSG